jgi:hypothetical protein
MGPFRVYGALYIHYAECKVLLSLLCQLMQRNSRAILLGCDAV